MSFVVAVSFVSEPKADLLTEAIRRTLQALAVFFCTQELDTQCEHTAA